MASKEKTRKRKHNLQCSGAADLLNGLLEAGLVLIHGGMNELIDVVSHIFDKSSLLGFLLPARCHCRVFWNRRGR
jgi:hypothetical protein